MKFDFTVLHEHPMGFGEQECAALDDAFFNSSDPDRKYPFYGGSYFGPHKEDGNNPGYTAPKSTATPSAQQQANLNCIFKP